ncbi:hypothetical protein ACWELJ_26895 [Nocardia sp. NPDC004582]
MTRNPRPAEVRDRLESLRETVEILADPGIGDEIRAAMAESERFTLDDIRQDLEARGGPAHGGR